MKGRARQKELLRKSAVAAGFSIVIGLVLLFGAQGSFLFKWSYDLPFFFKSVSIPDEVVIVYMDESSHRELQQPWDKPWNRALHAQMLDELTEAGVKAVAFDILFDVERDAEEDRKLIDATRRHGKVVFAATHNVGAREGQTAQNQITAPFPELLTAAAGWGLAETATLDQRVRRHFGLRTQQPSMALEMARLTMDRPLSNPSAERWVNYYGPSGTIPWLSYWQIMTSNAVPANLLSNKVVYVGARPNVPFSGGRSTDEYKVPFMSGGRAPGVEVNATTYLNLVRGDWLRRLPLVLEVGLITIVGIILGFTFARISPLRALVLGLVAIPVIAAIACAIVWRTNVWFPWLVVAGGQLPGSIFIRYLQKTPPRRVFTCYSRADRRDVFARIQGIHMARPSVNIFVDVTSIPTGAQWRDAVEEAILDCDIFYLFWSANARDSKEVENEWRLALEKRGLSFIRPVPLVDPVEVPPPDELKDIQFHDPILYLIGQPWPEGRRDIGGKDSNAFRKRE